MISACILIEHGGKGPLACRLTRLREPVNVKVEKLSLISHRSHYILLHAAALRGILIDLTKNFLFSRANKISIHFTFISLSPIEPKRWCLCSWNCTSTQAIEDATQLENFIFSFSSSALSTFRVLHRSPLLCASIISDYRFFPFFYFFLLSSFANSHNNSARWNFYILFFDVALFFSIYQTKHVFDHCGKRLHIRRLLHNRCVSFHFLSLLLASLTSYLWLASPTTMMTIELEHDSKVSTTTR